MAYRVVEESSLTKVADSIREQTGKAEQIPFPEGYEAAPAELVEAGKKKEYDRFWDIHQNYGKPATDYRYKFWYWENENYKPKYRIYSTNTSMNYVFQNARIENTLVDVDFSGTTTCAYVFGYCSRLHTIPKLIVAEQNTFTMAFQACRALVNLTVEGKFGNSIDLQWSTLLSKASITSVVNALSTTKTGLSLTLSQTAVDNAFTADEWNALAATRPNWTFAFV